MNSDEIYDLLFYIAHTNGLNAKKAKLVNDALLKRILLYCYDPFRRYYLTAQQVRGQGDEGITCETFNILDDLASRVISGAKAIYTIQQHMHDLTRKSAFLVNRILMKDMRLGLGAKSINSRFPRLIPEHKIMKAKLYDEGHAKWPMFSSPKIDGLRAIYHRDTFYTRGGKTFYGMDHLTEALKGMPKMDGELIIPGWEFNDMSGNLRSYDRSPLAWYYVWDLPDIAEPFCLRYRRLKELLSPRPENVSVVPHILVDNEYEAMAEYEAHRAAGFEGSVIKYPGHMYKDNRSYDWMKIKNIDTEDLRITGCYEGNGKYKGMMGGVYVDRKGVQCKVGGGWSDREREYYWKNFRAIEGRLIEVLFQESTKTGNMRHARYLRFRPDKEV